MTTAIQTETVEKPQSHRRVEHRGPVSISHVADFYRRYPGEDVTFYTRVDVHESVAGLSVNVTLPAGVEVRRAAMETPSEDRQSGSAPSFGRIDDTTYVTWNINRPIERRSRLEFAVTATIGPVERDLSLESHGYVTTTSQTGESNVLTRETVTVAVSVSGRYLRYLPALYQEDELMGRYLMLFESFLAPIEERIGMIWEYFDPRITPAHFLPWLATWADLTLDERWPEDRQRLLLRSIAKLYRKRGTKAGLAQFLEIYTGVRAEIIEYRSNNFRLGPENRLGQTVAIGMRNAPQSFHVRLVLPSIRGENAARKDTERRRIIESIIESEKPAHTNYTLEIETVEQLPEPEATPPSPVGPGTD